LNIAEYIASGILEEYLMGSATEQEQREVACMASIYPEIQVALDQLADGIEKYARIHAIAPPANLKENILSKLDFDQTPKISVNQSQKPEFTIVKNNKYPWAIAAASVLAVLSGVLWFQKNTLNKELVVQKTEVLNQKDLLTLYSSDTNLKIVMAGTAAFPKAKSMVFWNPKTKEVNLAINQLPQIANNKQYQLWAIVNGTPTDLGVFDTSTIALKMKSVAEPQAFAVTIEPKGGSNVPTLDQMCVLGKI
jgi:anti-sigma-K factor RskA